MKIKCSSFYSVLILFFLLLTVISAQNKKEIDAKVDLLLSQMTLAEKIGQMVQVDYYGIRDNIEDIAKYSIGSILCGGNTELDDISPVGWANTYDQLQAEALKSKFQSSGGLMLFMVIIMLRAQQYSLITSDSVLHAILSSLKKLRR
jgi:hypothetical protein